MTQFKKNGKVWIIAVCSRCGKKHPFPTEKLDWTCDSCIADIKAEKQAAIEKEKEIHNRIQLAKQCMAAGLAPVPIKVATPDELTVRVERETYLAPYVAKKSSATKAVLSRYTPAWTLSLEDVAPRNFKEHTNTWRLDLMGAINNTLDEIQAAKDILSLRRRAKFFRHIKKDQYTTKGMEWDLPCNDPDYRSSIEFYDPKNRGGAALTAEELVALQLRAKFMDDVTPQSPVFDHMESWKPTTKYEFRMCYKMYHAAQEMYGLKDVGKYGKYIDTRLWIFDGVVYDRRHTPKKVWKEFFRRFDPLYPKEYEEDPQEFTPFGIDLGCFWDSEDHRKYREVLIPNGTYQHDSYEARHDPYAYNPNRGELWYEELVSESESYHDEDIGLDGHIRKHGDKDYPLMLRRFFRLAVEKSINMTVSIEYDNDVATTPKPLDVMRKWNRALPDRFKKEPEVGSDAKDLVIDWVESRSRREIPRLYKMAREEYLIAKKMGGFFPDLMAVVGKELRFRLDRLAWEFEDQARDEEQRIASDYAGNK